MPVSSKAVAILIGSLILAIGIDFFLSPIEVLDGGLIFSSETFSLRCDDYSCRVGHQLVYFKNRYINDRAVKSGEHPTLFNL